MSKMSRQMRSHVQLLLVEDDKEYLQKLVNWLDNCGYQNISIASSAAEARARLDANLFDVIVADITLGAGDRGFAMLDEVQKRKITSVVIILTADESVSDSRRAFRKGAWDYISKHMSGNVFVELDQSICDALAYFKHWGGRREDEAWIRENMAWLVERYGEQYVAVLNHRVIEIAETEEALRERLYKSELPVFMPTIKEISLPATSEVSIAGLIAQGESTTLAFKSSLGWDVKEKRANQSLHFAVLATIAAFLNSEGGTLLIGVADDGTILGVEGDLSLQKGGTLDELRQTLVELIRIRISATFLDLIDMKFKRHKSKEICVVNVNSAAMPVFLRGQQRIEFWIRDGSMNRSLEGKEISQYIRTHWKKYA